MQLNEMLALLTVLLNLGGLVWGASKMDSATKNLTKIVDKMDGIVDEHEKRISRMEGRMSV